MAVNARLHAFVLECPDPIALATFYSDLTGWPVVESDAEWSTIRQTPESATQISFQQAPDYQAPAWPDPASSMQYHIDFTIDDIETAEQQALALGATKFDHQPGKDFRVYADPVGHPFCLCW